MIKNLKKIFYFLLAISIIFSTVTISEKNVFAAVDYPLQQINISTLDGKQLSVNNTNDNSNLIVSNSTGSSNERFKLTYVSGGYYKIVNIASGRLLSPSGWNTNSGTNAIIFGDANKQEQCWNIIGVDKDSYGNYLTYKITNYKNSNIALTYNLNNNSVTLSNYSGASNQKWKLNSSGLEGFAAYSKDMNGKEKAGTTGGVLGETVYINNLSDFQKYCAGDTPRTIVLSNSLNSSSLTKVKVGKNKTIIGGYGTSITNLYFYLDDTCNSGNLIMKNITFKHSASINANNDIQLYISKGTNFWVDHCTFEGHDMNKDTNVHNNDVDKLMYVGVKADFITVSHSKFGNHKYGLILGYPSDDNNSKATYTGYPRMTLSNNYFCNMTCRAPGLMRYGYFHSFNNYIENTHLAYTACTNANIYSEKNYFNYVDGIVDDYGTAKFTDEGSYPKVTASKSPATSWRPSNNYSYTTMNIGDLRTFTTTYSGSQNSNSNYTYSTFSSIGVPSAGYVVTSNASGNTGNSSSNNNNLVDGGIYYIKNVNSNLYLDVADGKDSNGTNIHQWTGNGYNSQKFKLVSTGDGCYKLISLVGLGNKVVDVSGNSSANGANISLYTDKNSYNQHFKFVALGNDRYNILTRCSNNSSAIEVNAAGKNTGDNVQQWALNGNVCQIWKLERAQ